MKETIVLIDDNMNDVELFINAVNDANLINPIKYYTSPNDALIDIKNDSLNKPFIIFIDIHMPELNGLDLLEQFRSDSTLKDTHIVMVSGSDKDADITAAMERGANAFINKPVTEDDIYKLINQLGIKIFLTSEKS